MHLSRKLKRRLGIVGLGALLFWAGVQWLPPLGAVQGENRFRARVEGRPLIIAHAGGMGEELARENSQEVFEESVRKGCDGLEMDVQLTKDGVLVTRHEPIPRPAGGIGAVNEFTVSELEGMNFGTEERPAHIGRLAEMLRAYPEMPKILHLKGRGEAARQVCRATVELLEKEKPRDVILASFDDATMAYSRKVAGPGIPVSCGQMRVAAFVGLSLVRLDRLWWSRTMALQVPTRWKILGMELNLARPWVVKAAHARNMALHYFTVNEPEEMRRLARMGVDGIMTDYPGQLKAVLEGKPGVDGR